MANVVCASLSVCAGVSKVICCPVCSVDHVGRFAEFCGADSSGEGPCVLDLCGIVVELEPFLGPVSDDSAVPFVFVCTPSDSGSAFRSGRL